MVKEVSLFIVRTPLFPCLLFGHRCFPVYYSDTIGRRCDAVSIVDNRTHRKTAENIETSMTVYRYTIVETDFVCPFLARAWRVLFVSVMTFLLSTNRPFYHRERGQFWIELLSTPGAGAAVGGTGALENHDSCNTCPALYHSSRFM